MSRETSVGVHQPYGLERVCRVLAFPRSTLYARQVRATARVLPLQRARRGPKPKLPDAYLLAAIRADLQVSPFIGEGHRKVWARLRILRGIRVCKDRVRRLMRENDLLSPYRRHQGKPRLHEGSIQATAPNRMWGTDGLRIETVEDGWVWVFCAVDHFDACCVGIHTAKIGNRFAALQPIAQGLHAEFKHTGINAGLGLKLRMDHGTQYTSDDFLKQIQFWGIQSSFAFVAEPQTNGVAERFNRTLKEQALHGRIFRNVEEVRAVVSEFRDRYNHHWRLEKLGFKSPCEVRQSHAIRRAA